MTDTQVKLSRLRSLMKARGLQGLRLRGVDWFSWITAGGSSSVILTDEIGVAEVLITLDRAWVLTNRIEQKRMQFEEVPRDFEVTAFAWQDDGTALTQFITENLPTGARVASDRPTGTEERLPIELMTEKIRLSAEDLARYRKIGRQAAAAMTDAMLAAKPDWSEAELAAAGAKALVERGLDPTLILVAGEERGVLYRHPLPKSHFRLGAKAMMVFCARGFGLYANLTRFVYFAEPTTEERELFEKLERIEAKAFQLSRPGETLKSVYAALVSEYKNTGVGEEIHNHHQGGLTGYLSREIVASPTLAVPLDFKFETNMAFAWNPSLPGAKVEDTLVISETGLEILTYDPRWPTHEVAGRQRPDLLIRKSV